MPGSRLNKVYHCVIPHVGRANRFLMQDTNPRRLPWVAFDGGWLPNEVGRINRMIQKKLGIRVTVMRHLAEDDMRQDRIHLCVLENHDPDRRVPSEYFWGSADDFDELALEPAEHREVLRSWIAEHDAQTSDGVSPWETGGWFDEAERWIESQLRRLRLGRAGRIEQIKGAWSGSSILRVPTDRGNLYFKADYQRPPGEPLILRELMPDWSRFLPRVLAHDLENHWLLMEEFGGVPLAHAPPNRRADAVRQFARIQIGSLRDTKRWVNLGCCDLSSENLVHYTRALFNEAPCLSRGPCRIESFEAAQLLDSARFWQRHWERLASYDVPEALTQLDFRKDNIRVTAEGFLYFDWTQTAVSHPFFSLNQFLDDFFDGSPPPGVDVLDWDFASGQDDARRQLRDAYLEPWTTYLPMTKLQEAFLVARQLNPLFIAIRLYLERPFLNRLSPYGKRNEAMTVACLKVVLRMVRKLQQ